MKTLFALATSEVQGDVVDTNAEAFGSMEEADNAARSFMLGRVGDFLDIDAEDYIARVRALEGHMSIETSEFCGRTRKAYVYRCGELCVSATVQEQAEVGDVQKDA